MLKELLAMSYVTTRIGEIVSPLHEHTERSKLHIFLKAPFGFTKTSEILELQEKGLAYVILEHSEAGLLGSAKGGVYYKGDIINGANKISVIDEYFLFENEARRHLLTIMSHGFAKRTFHTFSKTTFSDRGDGWEVQGDQCGFTLKINTAIALSTAVIEGKADAVLEMIQSRCFNLNYSFSKEDALEILTGERKVEKVKIRKVEFIDKVYLPEDVGRYLAQRIGELEIVPRDVGGYYMRAYWDMVKIASVYAVQDGRDDITKEDVDKALILYPIHSLGFIGNKLSKNEIEVYRHCRYKTTTQIAKEVGLSDRQVRRIINKLKELKLVKEVSLGGKTAYVSIIEV